MNLLYVTRDGNFFGQAALLSRLKWGAMRNEAMTPTGSRPMASRVARGPISLRDAIAPRRSASPLICRPATWTNVLQPTTLAANDLAFIQLASIGVWLRVNEPRPWFSATAISDRAEIGKKPLTVSTAPAEDARELLVIAALSRHGERCNPVTGLEMLREDRCCLGPCNSSE